MWKLMIADDEPKIRRGLKSQLLQMSLDIEVACEAGDGETALEMALREAPDIALVDINMPFVNGLDFIERLREAHIGTRIIVITGFEEFDYARRALSLGVQAYLLKPVEIAELHQALVDAIEQLEHDRLRERHLAWAVGQIEKRRESLREEFLSGLVAGELSEAEIDEYLPHMAMAPIEKMWLLMIRTHPGAEAERALYPRMLQYAFTDALKPALDTCKSAYPFTDDKGHVMVLCDMDEPDALLRAAKQAASTLGMSTDVACARADTLYGLMQCYDQLIETMRQMKQRPDAVVQAIAYVARHYGEQDLGLTEVANAVGVNPSYLSRLMKQELGMAFSKYLTATRIKAAVRLMRGGDIKVKQVAARVGYATPHYFSTAFKKTLGISPADYRGEERDG